MYSNATSKRRGVKGETNSYQSDALLRPQMISEACRCHRRLLSILSLCNSGPQTFGECVGGQMGKCPFFSFCVGNHAYSDVFFNVAIDIASFCCVMSLSIRVDGTSCCTGHSAHDGAVVAAK